MRKFFVGRAFVFLILLIILALLGVFRQGTEKDATQSPEERTPDTTSHESSDTGQVTGQEDPAHMEGDEYVELESQIVASRLPLDTLEVPDGFEISIYAADVPGARSMALSESGVLYVGTQEQGSVYAIEDRDHDGKADRITTIARGLNTPNGVAWKDGDLYVAQISEITKYENIDEHIETPPEPITITSDYPRDTHHGWKFIRFGPDGYLYVPVGAPCNVCLSKDPIYASITRVDVETGQSNPVVYGVRNTVGFDWDPDTDDMWFTDNGRDQMGDDIPGDELNHITNEGSHFGFPYCHADGIIDPTYGTVINSCDDYTSPELVLHPHGAALGMRFYTGESFPDRYQGNIFFAEHGSWNRSTPIGYQVSFVELSSSGEHSYEAFVRGWLRANGSYWGRPVDVQQMPDGRLLISDDYAGVIYQVRWVGEDRD